MTTERKAVLVTGCHGGVGSAICTGFMSEGFLVIGTDRVGSAAGACNLFVRLDLEDLVLRPVLAAELVGKVQGFLEANWGRLQVVVNNAATQVTGRLSALSQEAFERCHRVNVTAPFVLAKLFAPQLQAAKGSIINIGSIHGRLTKPGFGAYSVSKAAVSALTRALALDLAGDVTVNTIAPAAVQTPMLGAGFADQPDMLDDLASHHPAGRIADPSEVARLALFLASADARFITGAELCIDGGIGIRLHDPV